MSSELQSLDGPSRDRLAELLCQLSDETLTPGDWKQLNDLLADHPAAVDIYLEHQLQDGLLQREFASEQPMPQPPSPLAASLRDVRQAITRPTPFSLTVATLVMGLLITAMAFMAPPIYRAISSKGETEPLESLRIVAELTGQHEAIWADGQTASHWGAYLQSGHRMQLTQGLAEVTYRNGVQVILEGPCDFTVELGNAGTLADGKLTARVPKGVSGFEVRTAAATVVDLGTEFGMFVENDVIEIVVLDGEVEARSPDAETGSGLTIGEGQAFRFRPDGTRPQAIAATQLQFVRSVKQVASDAAEKSAQRYAEAVLADRPVAYWPLGDGESGTYRDLSGNQLHGQQLGGVAGDLRGPQGMKATAFDGTGVIRVPSNDLLYPAHGITVEAWVLVGDIPTIGRVAAYGTCWGFGYCRADQASNTLDQSAVRFTYYGIKDFDFPVVLSRGRWTHLAVAIDPQHVARLYVNGQPRGEIAGAAPRPPAAAEAFVGAAGGGEPWNGRLAHVAVYDAALSGDQIATHYQQATRPIRAETNNQHSGNDE